MDAKLVAISKRINAALDRVDEERQHVADIYAEAKSAGYIPKILRKAITRQRMDAAKRQEEDSILDLYDHALGTLGTALQAVSEGATWDEAVKATGVPRATLARAAAVSKRRKVIPDSETAEVRHQPGDDARTPEPSRSAEVVSNSSSGGVEGHAGYANPPSAALGCDAGEKTSAPSTKVGAGVEPGPLDTQPDAADIAWAREEIARHNIDGLDIPPALRRTRAA